MLVHCPICSNSLAEQVLAQYKVTVRKEAESQVGALVTYRCPAGHVFFVRAVDLLLPKAVAENPYQQHFGEH